MPNHSQLPNLHPDPQTVLDELPSAIYSRYSANPNGTIDSVGNQNEGGVHYVTGLWPGRAYRIYADDGISASHAETERPAFNQMRADIRAGKVGAVVGKSQARFLRNEMEWAKLRQDCLAAGIDQWHCWGKGGVVDIGRGKAIKSKIDLAIDSDYGETVSVNVRRAQESLARQGKANGGVCFGYVRGPRPTRGGATLVPDEEVAGVPQEIFERVLAGEPINAIAADLTAREIPTVRGRAVWRPTTVRALLRAPTVTALRVYKAEIVGEGNWDPVVDRETWDRMQVFLKTAGTVKTRDGRRVKRGYTTNPVRYLNSGIAACPHCGTTLSGSVRAGRSPMYLCPTSRGGCDRTSVSVKGVDDDVVAQLMVKLTEPKFRKWLARKDAHGADRVRLKRELEDIEVERDLNQAAKDSGDISRKTWMKDAASLDEREAKATRALDQLPPPTGQIDPDHVLEGWHELTLAEQRTILRAVLHQVVIHPATRGGNRFDVSRVDPRWRHLP